MKPIIAVLSLMILVAVLATAGAPGACEAQTPGCKPRKQGPFPHGDGGCNGLADLTFRVHDAVTGAHLGDVNGGCWPCSTTRCATINKAGYRSYRACARPNQSLNGKSIHYDVWICPNPTPTPPPTPTPTPAPPPGCDADYITLLPPSAGMVTEPDRPVVVGQDKEKRGVDMHVTAHAGKAEHHEEWWEKVCDEPGCIIPEEPWHWACVDHTTESYVDHVCYVGVNLRLGDDSVAWIKGELAGRYPGAKVLGEYPETFILYDEDEGCIPAFHDSIFGYQTQDPGEYGGRIVVQTEGTPLSVPQRIDPEFDFRVWMREATIWW